MINRKSFCRYFILAAAVGLGVTHNALALQPDEIALVVNSNVPDGVTLAKFYAQQRHIPENRILVLDLPKTDQMTCRQYEDQVVPQVRDFLHTSHLESKLKCMVTFYGVPLRIEARVNTAEENNELTEVRHLAVATPEKIRPAIEAIEAMAIKLNADFVPDHMTDMDNLLKRQDLVFGQIVEQLKTVPDLKQRIELADQFYDLARPLIGDASTIQKLRLDPALEPTTAPAKQQPKKELVQAEQQYRDAIAEAGTMENLPDDIRSRAKLREIVGSHFGAVALFHLLEDQADYLDATSTGFYNTASSFDNELAMVEWKKYHHRGFLENPLHYDHHASEGSWPTLMVTRLDGEQPETVKSMIITGIKVEENGLAGHLVIDARGIKAGGTDKDQAALATYDQFLRNLADLARDHTDLQVILDDKPEVLPAGSADHVAMYCGWYSVRNYISCCKFNPGAIGYHIASYEMVSLRQAGESGWVRGLLNDGVVGTLGPVAEPYLGTFPRPDDFFPLVMTGKLTLAEAYWTTEPTVSWMMGCIGDPLYTPYKNNPPLKASDLPERLQVLFMPTPGAAPPPFGLPGVNKTDRK